MTTHKEALEAAYLAGFNASGEGYNGEYPFGDKMQDPAENSVWKKDRDNYIKEVLAQPAVPKGHKQSTPCGEPVAWETFALKFANGTRLSYEKPTDLPKYLGCRPLYTAPPTQQSCSQRQCNVKPLTDEQIDFLNFLYGAGEWDGVWFEGKHPTKKGAFWWRKDMKRLFDYGIKE